MFLSEAHGPPPNACACWQNSVSCVYWTEVFTSLLAFNQEWVSAPGATYSSVGCDSFHLFPGRPSFSFEQFPPFKGFDFIKSRPFRNSLLLARLKLIKPRLLLSLWGAYPACCAMSGKQRRENPSPSQPLSHSRERVPYRPNAASQTVVSKAFSRCKLKHKD